MRKSDKKPSVAVLIVVLIVLIIVSAILATAFGASAIPVRDLVDVLRARIFTSGPLAYQDAIVWNMRVPRILLSCFVGAGLSLAGCIIQTLVRNPLADPYLIGISSGASMGAAGVITLGVLSSLGIWALSVGALVGALIAAAAVFGITQLQGGITPLRLILTGTVLSAAFSAVSSYLIISSEDPQAAQSVLFWLLGSLAGAKWNELVVPVVVIALSFVLIMLFSDWLDALACGEDVAQSLGVPVKAFRNFLFVVQAVLVGTMVAVSGAIGFIGLIVPHMARMLVGSNHRSMIPIAALLGALFTIWIDVAARVIAIPREVPLSVVTGIVGAPVFLFLLGRRKYRFGSAS